MPEGAQADIFVQLLREFQKNGILDDVMLIGSWCLSVYRSALRGAQGLPAIRTLDADFLIPNQRALRQDLDVPILLKELGFVPTPYHMSGWVVYDHPELRVEFLVPEQGAGRGSAHSIKKLHVTAQGLRYLNLLADHPRKLTYAGLSICVPEPAAFALQKLIVSQRRSDPVKRQRDVDTAIAVLDYVLSNSRELRALREILRRSPKGWLRTLTAIARQNYPKLEAYLMEHSPVFLKRMEEAVREAHEGKLHSYGEVFGHPQPKVKPKHRK